MRVSLKACLGVDLDLNFGNIPFVYASPILKCEKRYGAKSYQTNLKYWSAFARKIPVLHTQPTTMVPLSISIGFIE